jgi:protein O-GlcNAc transferase
MKEFFRRLLANVAEPTNSVADETIADDPDEVIAQGHAIEDQGDFEGARMIYERAVSIAPRSPRAHLNLGNALKLLGRMDEAEAAYGASIEIKPDYAEGHMNLGNLYLQRKDLVSAASSYKSAIRYRPEWAEAGFALGYALKESGDLDGARQAFETVLQSQPANGKAAASLADILSEKGMTREALSVLAKALDLEPRNLPVNIALAEIQKNLGDNESAANAYRSALKADPDNGVLLSSYLFALNFLPVVSNEEVMAEHARVESFFAAASAIVPAVECRDSKRKLRIGYVSADFRRHSVSCFFEPLLRHHDREFCEVHCYYNHVERDDITERFEALSDRWCDIAEMSDEAVASRIVDDQIDLLVDLAGHTTGNRLGVFARKPAPIQFTWLGYLCTTGLRAIDYRLCDRYTDPPGVAEQWQVETPARLADSQWCYQPQVSIPDVSALPILGNGYWTFGSFNQASKLNSTVVEAWANVLAAIPGSRIRIFGIVDNLHVERIRQQMALAGIAEGRIDIIGRIPIDSYFEAYREVDIALDTFPYNGATTTCDALIMGVPVASVSGERPISRGGLSLLSTLGLDDWVVDSPAKLVDMLQEQTRDPGRLAKLRSSLPQRMRNSALMDAELFSTNVEAIYRAAWRKFCNTQGGADQASEATVA